MKKIIDVSESNVKKLKILAAIKNTNVKNYIENLVINDVKRKFKNLEL